MNLQSFCFTTFSPSLSGFRRQSVKRCVMGCVVCRSFSTISSKQDRVIVMKPKYFILREVAYLDKSGFESRRRLWRRLCGRRGTVPPFQPRNIWPQYQFGSSTRKKQDWNWGQGCYWIAMATAWQTQLLDQDCEYIINQYYCWINGNRLCLFRFLNS